MPQNSDAKLAREQEKCDGAAVQRPRTPEAMEHA
jgi:hypothetical protein